MVKKITLREFLERDYPQILRDFEEERKTGVRLQKRKIRKFTGVIRKQWTKGYKTPNRRYFISLKVLTKKRNVTYRELKHFSDEIEINLSKQGLFKGFMKVYDAPEKVEIDKFEDRKLEGIFIQVLKNGEVILERIN